MLAQLALTTAKPFSIILLEVLVCWVLFFFFVRLNWLTIITSMSDFMDRGPEYCNLLGLGCML